MKSYIKQILLNHASQGFVKKPVSKQLPFNLEQAPAGYFRSFGKRNPDKIFYIIWRSGMGSGFFSNFSHVLCHLKIADAAQMTPVIDFQNFPTLYNDEGVETTRNAWEYYFKPVSPYLLEEVYQSKNVFFCSGSHPKSLSTSLTEVNGLYQIYEGYIKVQNNVKKLLEQYSPRFQEGRTLGVHFRGQEQKHAPGHYFPPTEGQMIKHVDTLIDKHSIEKIFFVSEEQKYLDLFIKRYGKRVFYTDSFRTYGVNAYNLNPREKHRYLLGLDILIDASLLAVCHGILCGDSNVSEFARFTNNGKYEFKHGIYNGVNSSNPVIARYLFGIKKILPSRFGGLCDTSLF